MTAFNVRAASSYAAALAVTVWSAAMLVAATAVPSVSAIASFA
jgi:hypothetical protein